MNDMKSKLPDMEELTSMTTKLFKDIKTSVGEIVADYKKNRAQAAKESEAEAKPKTKTTAKPKSEEEPKE